MWILLTTRGCPQETAHETLGMPYLQIPHLADGHPQGSVYFIHTPMANSLSVLLMVARVSFGRGLVEHVQKTSLNLQARERSQTSALAPPLGNLNKIHD